MLVNSETRPQTTTLGLALMRAGTPVRHRRIPAHLLDAIRAVSAFTIDKVATGEYTAQLAVQPDGSRVYDLSQRACFMVNPGGGVIDLNYQIWTEVRAYIDDYFDVTPAHKLLPTQSMFLYNLVGGGIATHVDDKPGTNHPARSVIAMVYTNEGYEGGDLEFPRLNQSFTPTLGDMLIFPTNYPHRVTPLTRGVRTAWQCGYFITDPSGVHTIATK